MNTLFTNGVIAVRERSLLGEKILRLAEGSAEEAFRAITESGFGNGSEAVSAADAELLCAAENRALDGFLREYAPTKNILEYFLLPRDYHNAKALVKAEKLGAGGEELFAPEGTYPLELLSSCIKEGRTERLGKLGETVKAALSEDLSGAETGFLFDSALNERLMKSCHGVLKKLLVLKTDRRNVLTVLRSSCREQAEKFLLPGGSCKREELLDLLEGKLPADPGLASFCRTAQNAKEKGLAFTESERILRTAEAEYFAARKYELENKQPFLYYVFRRIAEIENVRILLVCLFAGMDEQEIKKRLRAV